MEKTDPPTRPTPATASTIRRRLLERVADADRTHRTVDADAGDWQALLDGITIKVLHEDASALSYLLHFEAGARLPPHRHPQDEECVVLAGRLRVGTRIEVGPGAYHRARAGSLHATILAVTAATVFLRGAAPDPMQLIA